MSRTVVEDRTIMFVKYCIKSQFQFSTFGQY